MRLDPPQVLLEASFLAALADRTHPDHARCAAVYASLLDDVDHDRLLLAAVGDHLRPHLPPPPDDPIDRAVATVRRLLRPTGLLAPVHHLHVGGQHRRAARRSTAERYDVALTLVMCDRHRIRRIATIDPVFERYDLQVEAPDRTAD